MNDEVLSEALVLMIRRCPAEIGRDAATALLSHGNNRGMRYRALLPRALDGAEWTDDERELLANAAAGSPGGTTRSVTLQVRMTAPEKEWFAREAAAARVTVSELARQRLLPPDPVD